MWITNIPGYFLPTAHHPDPGSNSVLIRIGDPDITNVMSANDFPIPQFPFNEIHQFRFLDMTDDNLDKLPTDVREKYSNALISDEQARDLVNILIDAYNNKSNVIVHCSAGICRSGAITEVGVMMGFEDINNSRIPNLLVKRKLINQLTNIGFFN